MNFDKAYLISLEQSPKRRNHFYKYADRAGLSVEWVPAIYGLDVNIAEYQHQGYLADDFKLNLAGSLGTLLSHVHIWEKIAEDPQCEVGLIFEDDAIFDKNFKKQLNEIATEDIPEDWDMIWLGWHKIDCDPVNKVFGKPKKDAKRGANSGHFAYLIKSSSVDKMKSIILPYNNRNSKDVILRKNFNRFNAYFMLKKIAKTPLLGFTSVRKDINDPNRLNNRFIKQVIQKLRKRVLDAI